ncbi:replicative DNA helicase [uncultured Christiangramia sp.]|uniref:replicative DNA helicase n=1 Tax=uncultured Christiangramia sp. TaxID=503836 RepID=UPI002607A3BC|nr:replicative DNA helicase [uncultured Christiangramia sp.]
MQKLKPPHAVELEAAVLGAAIGYGGTAEIVEIFRKEKVFFDPKHQAIYNVMLALFERSEGIDILTISNELRKQKKLDAVGGDIYIIELTQKVTTSAEIEFHARIIQQMFVKRRSIQVGEHLSKQGYDESADIFDTLEESYRELDKVSDWLFVKKPTDFKGVVGKLFESANKGTTGVPCSLKKMQSKTNGYQDTDLVILAARPGMGKTALMINDVRHQAKQGIPVGIFSLEMSDKQLAGRIASNELKIDNSRISKNTMDDSELRILNERRGDLESLPIYIHDQPAISPLELKIQASKWKREKGVKIIYVDYLQLMRLKSHKGNKETEISEISAALKGIAKELEMPVIALAQLSRSVETRGGSKRPILSDLRDSGSIEQDADMVMFLFRPEYYKIEEWDNDERSSTKNQAEINIAKYRNGQVGACIVGTRLQYMQFHDLEEDDDFDSDYDEIPPAPKPNHDMNSAFEPAAPQDQEEDDLPF